MTSSVREASAVNEATQWIARQLAWERTLAGLRAERVSGRDELDEAA